MNPLQGCELKILKAERKNRKEGSHLRGRRSVRQIGSRRFETGCSQQRVSSEMASTGTKSIHWVIERASVPGLMADSEIDVDDSMQNEAEDGKKLAHQGFYRGTILVDKQLIPVGLVWRAATCTLVQVLPSAKVRRGVYVWRVYLGRGSYEENPI
jgi:hypothetical protein